MFSFINLSLIFVINYFIKLEVIVCKVLQETFPTLSQTFLIFFIGELCSITLDLEILVALLGKSCKE